jgi:CheY-like chemotaxis protein/transcriptional regulator with XRE-family HTH domain
LGVDRSQGVGFLQRTLVRAMDGLRPQPTDPPTAPIVRFYKLLSLRYVQGLTQEAAAARLGMDTRYLRKQQQKAVRALARLLWEASQHGPSALGSRARASEIASAEAAELEAESPDWAMQVQQELTSLIQKAPDATASVETTLRDVLDLSAALTYQRSIRLSMKTEQPQLQAAIHPSALRQILLAGITSLVQSMACGEIILSAKLAEGSVRITIAATPAGPADPSDLTLIQKIANAYHGTTTLSREDGVTCLLVDLPACALAARARVLVIEDNTDLVSFYQAYTYGTRYEILHATGARRALEMVEAHRPDLIVLDVMLPDPDMDGWKLLMQLHGDAKTRAIPVVVCSVVRERELALALGAAVYVPKPVARRGFLAALESALCAGSEE